MRKLAAALAFAVFMVPFFTQSATADDFSHDHWRGDIHHFNTHDRAYWQHGHWYEGKHKNRGGWWWVVNNGWYYYPSPIYPYPNPFVPSAVVVRAPDAVAPAPLSTIVAAHYYYCTSPGGFYPYVATCGHPWHAVVR